MVWLSAPSDPPKLTDDPQAAEPPTLRPSPANPSRAPCPRHLAQSHRPIPPTWQTHPLRAGRSRIGSIRSPFFPARELDLPALTSQQGNGQGEQEVHNDPYDCKVPRSHDVPDDAIRPWLQKRCRRELRNKIYERIKREQRFAAAQSGEPLKPVPSFAPPGGPGRSVSRISDGAPRGGLYRAMGISRGALRNAGMGGRAQDKARSGGHSAC